MEKILKFQVEYDEENIFQRGLVNDFLGSLKSLTDYRSIKVTEILNEKEEWKGRKIK